MSSGIVNVIGPKFCEDDRKLFNDDDKLIQPDADNMGSMAHLLAFVGKFKSVSEARKNGWDRPVPKGWSEFKIGKNANQMILYIWNPERTLEEFIQEFGDD